MATDPRRKNGARRNAIRKRIASFGLPCALCGAPIDYTLGAGEPLSFEVDEIVPVSLGGNPLDISNCQPAHRHCNLNRSNMTMQQWRSREAATKARQAPNKTTTQW